MRTPPVGLADETVLAAVRAHWDAQVEVVEHLPLGFGAHHWRADGPSRFFVTLDQLEPRHSAASLEAAYAGATALADDGLEFVLAGIRHHHGRLTIPLAGGVLSVTAWQDGTSGDGTMSDHQAHATRAMLDRLHRAAAPAGLPRWAPLVSPGLADDLAACATGPWTAGPHGEQARSAIRRRLPAIARWLDHYHRVAASTDPGSWVATHGEPHTRNQLRSAGRTWLVDWESLKLAPRERDLRSLAVAGHPQPDADPRLLEMFDLEWRLDEIGQFAEWFRGPHGDGEDDRIALEGLVAELERPGEPFHIAVNEPTALA